MTDPDKPPIQGFLCSFSFCQSGRGISAVFGCMLEESKTTRLKESGFLNHHLEERHPPIHMSCFGFHETKI